MSQLLPVATAADQAPQAALVLEERIRYTYSRPVANVRQRLRVVPPLLHGRQRRRRWHMAVHGVTSAQRRTFVDRFGNVTVDVWVPKVAESVEFAVEVEAEPGGPRALGEVAADGRYLRHTRLTAPDQALARLARAGERDDVAAL